MRYELFRGRRFQIIDLDDVTGEHVIEFADPETGEAILAVYSGEGCSEVYVSTSPKMSGVPADFVEWAIAIARRRL
ncbi:hypothetical protein EQW78_05075 [Oerskovia turbata]|uniref:Uncharacterized protein n=1 Tax=Oerskovia turbata TaxID=1713 RepID=A0A4Q1KZH9_9CELL|nr:hypothetical protein [Oerskovia turbata]RXR27865.1 hypothetical protein EQW73_00675 [Oerskovia turbata]RXR35697.1 hypothetical protein EQW78_05075 [Oerskovia turbata]